MRTYCCTYCSLPARDAAALARHIDSEHKKLYLCQADSDQSSVIVQPPTSPTNAADVSALPTAAAPSSSSPIVAPNSLVAAPLLSEVTIDDVKNDAALLAANDDATSSSPGAVVIQPLLEAPYLKLGTFGSTVRHHPTVRHLQPPKSLLHPLPTSPTNRSAVNDTPSQHAATSQQPDARVKCRNAANAYLETIIEPKLGAVFVCSICEKKFRRRDFAEQHVSQHGQLRPAGDDDAALSRDGGTTHQTRPVK